MRTKLTFTDRPGAWLKALGCLAAAALLAGCSKQSSQKPPEEQGPAQAVQPSKAGSPAGASNAPAQPAAPSEGAKSAESNAAVQASSPAATGVPAKCRQLLRKTSDFYASLKSFSGTASSHMKVKMQGMNSEVEETVRFALERPNRLALRPEEGGAAAPLSAVVVCDGTNLYTYVPALNRYEEKPAPKEIDGLPGGLSPLLMARSPLFGFLDGVFRKTPYDTMMEDVISGRYVGRERIGQVPCHHLAFHMETLDWDIWIADGPQPFILKIVPDVSRQVEQLAKEAAKNNDPNAAAMAGMSVETVVVFSDWKVDPKLPGETFAFTPPPNAEKVDSLLGGEQESRASPLEGKPAPALNLDLLDGGKLDLSAHKGKHAVVLDFWATWCPPCRKAMPEVIRAVAAYKDKGAVLYAVNEGEKPAAIRKFLKQQKLDVTVALDPDGKAGDLYGVEGIPQTVIIDKQGNVAKVHVGYMPGLEEELKREIEKALGQ